MSWFGSNRGVLELIGNSERTPFDYEVMSSGQRAGRRGRRAVPGSGSQ